METPLDADQPSTPGQELILNRQVDLDTTLDQLWRLVSERANLEQWLGESLDLEMKEGAVGTLLDDGLERAVRVDRIDPRRSVEITWWPGDEPDESSRVALRIVERPGGGTRLDITETRQIRPSTQRSSVQRSARSAFASSEATRWEVRVLSLWACTVAAALVASAS